MAVFYISDPKVTNLLTINHLDYRIYSYCCSRYNAKKLESFIKITEIAGFLQLSLQQVQETIAKLAKIKVEDQPLFSITDTGTYLKFDMPRHKVFIQSLGFKKFNSSRGWKSLKEYVSPELNAQYKFADLDQYQLKEKLRALPKEELEKIKPEELVYPWILKDVKKLS